MLKTLLIAGTLLGTSCSTQVCFSQRSAKTVPTASATAYLQAGVGATYGHTDYGQEPIKGVSGFFDYNFAEHFGVEAAVHYIAFVTPQDLAENTYVIGPRFTYNYGRFTPHARVVGGLGSLVIQLAADNQGKYNGNYLMYGVGAGVDATITPHLIVRAIDFEYQEWPGLGHGLTPFNVTVGVAYRFH